MNNNLRLILFSFIRQAGADGCGAACLAAVIKYNGLNAEIPAEFKDRSLSLFQMQQLAESLGLKARAVQMDIENLPLATSPCILHILNDDQVPHFITCYGYEPELGCYLIGDPDRQVCYIPDTELLRKWQSKAVLVFEQSLPKKSWRARLYPWANLVHLDFVPGVLWIAVPFLNTFATLLGFGAMLVIEKAVSPDFLNGELNLMILVFALLLSLSAAKCVINFIKQRLIINFAGKTDMRLYMEMVPPPEKSLFNPVLIKRKFYETIKDVQRIHQSASMLIGGIACDGFIMLIMFTCLYFYFPMLVLPEAFVVCALLWITDRNLPFMLVNYQSSQTVDLMGGNDALKNPMPEETYLTHSGIAANAVISKKSGKLSNLANKLNFYSEALTSGNLLLILAYAIYRLRLSGVSYQEFIFGIILCYGIVATATKICNQLFLVAQGVEILNRHKITG